MSKERQLTREEVAYALNVNVDTTVNNNPGFNELKNGGNISRGDIINALHQVYISIHADLFHATHGFDSDENKAGSIDRQNSRKLIGCMRDFARSLYDRDGQLLETVDRVILAESMAKLYNDVSELSPFSYGNNLTLRTFITQIGEIDSLKSIIPDGIDFRRMDMDDSNHIHTHLLDQEVTGAVCLTLFDKNRDRKTGELALNEKWKELPNARIDIEDYRFLTYEKDNNVFLVRHDGFLVEFGHRDETGKIVVDNMEISKAIGEHLSTTKPNGFYEHINDFIIPNSDVVGHISGEDISPKIDKNASAHRLVCLDVDILTGLEIGVQMDSVLRHLSERKVPILELPERLDELLYKKEHLDMEERRINARLERAAENIREMRPVIEDVVQRAFSEKTQAADGERKLYMSLGGTGVGKSASQNFASQEVNGNLVIASLDESRYESDVHHLLTKAGHHSDDYKMIEQFAKIIRTTIIEKAMNEGYNLFIDGSGIPYKGRNDVTIGHAVEQGYTTHILCAEAPLHIEDDRGRLSTPVPERWTSRFEDGGHLVPQRIGVIKNIQQPTAQAEAMSDPRVDSVRVFDNGIGLGNTYVREQTFTITAETLNDLRQAKNDTPEALRETLGRHNLLPRQTDNSLHIPIDEKDINVNFRITAKHGEDYTVNITWDNVRTIDGVQKGSLNPNARGPKELTKNSIPYHVPEVDYPHDERKELENSFAERVRLQVSPTAAIR